MNRHVVSVLASLVGAIVLGDSACTQNLAKSPSNARIQVSVTSGPSSSPSSRLPLSFSVPEAYTINVQALKEDGTPDTSFNGYVRLSAQPGSLQRRFGPRTRTGGTFCSPTGSGERTISVSLLAAYGNTNIWAEDEGYLPADPARVCTAGMWRARRTARLGSPAPRLARTASTTMATGSSTTPTTPVATQQTTTPKTAGATAPGPAPLSTTTSRASPTFGAGQRGGLERRSRATR